MNQKHSRHQGLILLIVLGMLSLFSLLAISFMVVTSQSRRSNAGRASRDFRGTAPEKLLDDAIRPVLRGTTDPSSFLRGQSLLADLHGSQEQPLRVRVRNTMFGVTANLLPPNNPQNYTQPITHNSAERPLLLAGRFLRIPIVMNNRSVASELPRDNADFPTTTNPNPIIDPQWDLPFENDAWTSRVATFLSGPLQGQSFRIVRYIGFEFVPNGTPAISLAQSYSIVIDLQDAAAGLATVGTTTRSIAEWASQLPIGSNQVAKRGLFLCYGNVPASGTAQLNGGYDILINATPLNSHGMGITGNLANPSVLDTALVSPDPAINAALSAADVNLRDMPAAFQPNRTNSAPITMGDADEDYDAADYQNLYLSHSYAGATDSSMVIPSFHRAALINYIVNAKDPANYENGELYLAVHRILRAAGRPLSVRVIDGSIGDSNNQPATIITNPDFDGGNQGQFTAAGDERSTQLNVVWQSATSWQDTDNPTGVTAFLDWVRWLTKGPWDVDNDGDGVYDGIWIDPNLPLITSREGKLLKAMVSYTIESLDSKLDINATGNLQQTADPAVYDAPTNANYAVGPGQHLPQGFGYGPADTSLRHLFGAGNPGRAAYNAFLQNRYSGRSPNAPNETLPGIGINDVRSQLNQREIRPGPLGGAGYTHSVLPAVPPAVFGRLAIGIDRLGNPILNNSGTPQVVNEPYESGILSGGRGDALYSIAEWERMTRLSNWDRSSLPRRLNSSIAAANVVTPRSRHLRHIPASVSRNTGRQSTSMYELVREMFAFNPPRDSSNMPIAGPLSYQAYRELFPLEFQQGRGFNINRMLGNGVDEDGDGNVDEIEEQLKNGIDENNNGVVDEAAERDWTSYQQRSVVSGGSAPFLQNASLAAEAPIPGQIVIGGTAYNRGIFEGALDPTFEAMANAVLNGGANTDSDGDGQRDIDTLRYHFGAQSRQLLARNLYCLAMLILPDSLHLSNYNDPSTGAPAPLTGDERARRLAQWAVNVVDFRDADSAMTRFPYDPDPFRRPTTSDPFWQPNPAAGQVVWGMEQPDVVLTESLATHDLRVRDTTNDSSSALREPTGDDDLDQVRLPEGSAFLELMALRTTSGANATNVPGVAGGTHVTVGGLNQLNLSALTPAIDVEINSTTLATQYPVYRVVFSSPTVVDRSTGNSAPHGRQLASPPPDPDPATPLGVQEQADRLTTTYQISNDPNRQNGLAWDESDLTELAPVEIDRVLIFAPWSNNLGIPDLPASITPDQYENRVFSNSSSAGITLFGGQYLVVGPRETTFFGSRNLGPGSFEHAPNPHRIALADSYGLSPALVSGDVTVFGTDQANTTPNVGVGRDLNYMRPIQTMIAAQSAPWSATVTGQGGQVYQRPTEIGLNVSAPYRDAYYPAPREVHDSSDTMDDSVTGAPGYASREADAYYDFDAGLGTLPGAFDATRGPLSDSNAWPIRDSESQVMPPEPGQGTMLNYCTAFLQRLADPERPWHRDLNPYITVDWIPMDLTVFNGEDAQPNPAPEFAFGTRQKTGAMANVAGVFNPLAGVGDRKTIQSYGTTEPQQSTHVVGSNAHFDVELPLDWNRGPASRPTQTDAAHFATLGYLNSTFTLAGETAGSTFATDYVGAPMDVPSSLLWLDRAYTNAAEMAWVPLSSPGQLMQEFSAPNGPPSGATGPVANQRAPSDLVHLKNFVQPVPAQDGSNNQLAPATLFDLVETPSPWIDAEEFVSPGDIALTPVNPNLLQQAVNYIFEPHRAPYNRLSSFTEPGRININDVAEPAVWQGIVWNSLDQTERETVVASPREWARVLESRRGYVTSGGGNIPNANPLLNPNVPSQFAGVFKSTFAAGMVPPTRAAPLLDGAARNASGGLERPAGVTLMRSDASGASIFRPEDTDYASMQARHPFMDYQPVTRLQNLVTTRSNVFSVRVTLGFFEYNSATGIGREYGIDEGTAKRHKAFYVIDRSIPVGYQEGLDLNTEQCILMRRIIE
ncbi:MAG: hypothetical protein Aurels2KO_07290 [Aureliella sp.]